MIDLSVPARTVAGIDLAGDDQDPYSFWVLPGTPSVAAGPDGAPLLHLLRVVTAGQLTSGLFEMTVELRTPQAALDAARAQLALELKDEHDRVTLNALPITGGEVELLFLGPETRADGDISPLVRRSYGTALPKLLPTYTASLSVQLTADGTRLLEAALRAGGAPIGIAYRLQVEALRPAQQIIAHVDWGRVYDQVSSESKQGALFLVDDVRRMAEQLVETKAITVQVVQELSPAPGQPAPDTSAALDWILRELVDRFCQPVLPLDRRPAHASLGTAGDLFGVGSAYGFKNLTQVERAVADVDFTQRAVVVRTLTQVAHLADLLGQSPAGDHISDAAPDDPFFAQVALHVACARPLAQSFVSEVDAVFTYGPTQVPIRLDAQSSEGRATAYADHVPDRTWTLPLDLQLSNDAPVDPGTKVHLAGPSGQGRELLLDLEQLLGLHSVDLVGSSDVRVLVSRADLQQRRAGNPLGEPRGASVAPQQPKATVWLRDFRPGDTLDCTTHHLLADGRTIDLPAVPVQTRVYRLPPPFPGSMTVQILSDDDWTDLTRLVLTIQKNEQAPAGTFVFDKPGAGVAVSLDLPDPADRTYRYKIERTLTSGSDNDDWRTSDASVLFIGRVAANKLVVDVKTLGDLELPEAGINTIEVMLLYLDPDNQIRKGETAVLHARADTFHWEVELKDPSRRSYDYQITIYRTSGKTEVGTYSHSSDRTLFIPIVKG